MRVAVSHLLRRFAAIVMLAAVAAFNLQAAFIAPSGAATEQPHYHHGSASEHGHEASSHEVTHAHDDGTVHRHAVNDDDGALDDHIQEPGCPCCWNMAIVSGVLTGPMGCAVSATPSNRLAVGAPVPYRDTEPNGLRRPPRPPGIA